jgi:hypothetical protein
LSPIAVNASNLVLGPARLYVAPYGSAEPLDSAVTPNGTITPPSASVWTDVGGTEGGVIFEAETTYTALDVDQIIMNVGARLTGMKMMITTKLAEVTLGNLNNVLNQITQQGAGTGYQTLDITVTTSASQPIYTAYIIDGWAPYLSSGFPALRRIIMRKVLSQVKVSLSYDKKGQASYGTTLQAYYVSGSINPVHIIDQLA